MARGDVTVFNEAKAKMIDGDWASTDAFYLAILTNAVAPAATSATPNLWDFTQVVGGGTYTTDGATLGTLGNLVSSSGATMTFDSPINPTWAQDASNATGAAWGLIFNHTDANKDALAFVDLDGPVDMTAGDLTITWDANGIFTIV